MTRMLKLVGEEQLRDYVTYQKIIANENRLKILLELVNGPKSFSDLMFYCKINPKALRDHLVILMKDRFVEVKNTIRGNRTNITEFGIEVLKYVVANMKEVRRFSKRLAEK